MYKEGNILYFKPFYFKNGNTAKNKYFIVLKVVAGQTILASLPTRTDSIPQNEMKQSGCIELPGINLNCFVLSPEIPITVCKKHLDFPTHVYGHQLDTYELALMENVYRIEGSDYEIFGQMEPTIFVDLIKCLKESKIVKNKYLRMLQH